MLRLLYGSYEFTLTPNVQIDRKIQDEDNAVSQGDVEIWTLSGELVADDADSLASVIADFNTACSQNEVNLQLLSGQNVLLSMNSSDCWESPRVISTKLYTDEESKPFVRNAKFVIEILGEKLESTGSVQSHTHRIEISEDIRKKVTKTITGEYKVIAGTSASGMLNTVVSNVSAGFKRDELTYETDAEDKTLKYKVVDVTEFNELPAEVYDGYIIESEESADSEDFKLLQGIFYGPGALTQAKALKPSNGLVSYRISENPQEQKVEFTYKQRVKSEGQTSSKRVQRISYETKLSFKDFKILGTDVADCRQKLGNSDFLVVQEGYAISENTYPSPASPVQSGEVIERLIVYEFPEGVDNSKIFKTRWKFVMKPLKTPFEQAIRQN